MPKVSVIIPAYNAERWLPETLESVAVQGLSNLEVIIVDDGSTDGTAAYVVKQWPQFKLVSTANKGVSHARNMGTSLASGDFIQYLDADDLLMPGKLARQIQMLAATPDIDVVYSNWQRLVLTPDGTFQPGMKVERTIAQIHADAEIAFFTNMWCPTGAYLYRRGFLAKVGPWKPSLPVIQDARFALDCARAGARWAHDPHISVLYRQHSSGSISTSSHIAFLKDQWTNTLDMEQLWAVEGSLSGGRREAVLHSMRSLVRAFYELDKPMFETAYAHLLQFAPDFQPEGRLLPMLSALVGYRKAEEAALYYRRVKRLLGVS